MKDYHINIFKVNNEPNKVIVTQDINRKGTDYLIDDLENGWKKRYILEVGNKVVDIFGNIVTIKEILHHKETETTNYIVEENGNCYCPGEFAGLFVKYLTLDELKSLVNYE